MISEKEALDLMTSYVSKLYLGQKPGRLPSAAQFPQELQGLVENIGLLGDAILEIQRFAEQLSEGNLDAEVPGPQNYLSAHMKGLHARLMGLRGNLGKQPDEGGHRNLQEKGPGGHSSFASSIWLEEQGKGDREQQWSRAVNSWRYHQIVSAMGQLHIMMLEVDAAGNILYANPPFKAMFPELSKIPYEKDDNRPKTALMAYLGTFGEFGELLAPAVTKTDRFPVLRELYDPKRDAWYKITTDRIRLVGGAYGLLHMIDDISEWKRHESQLRKSASIDDLTGAYTRGAGILALNEAFEERAATHSCVAFADVDGLKAINDTYGHTEGDFTLKTVADIFTGCVRKSDWVIRYGGDEFVIIFRDCTMEIANTVIARMQEKLEEINKTLGKPYRLSFSIGCTAIERGYESVDELLAVVDRLMYEKKREKRMRDETKPVGGPYGK